MAVNAERGSAILFLFIAVAAFGALSYALLQGSRGNTAMITAEADKAKTYQSQDCSNALNMATKRLQMRGCEATQISSDVTGAVGAGPPDGTCAIFHPSGGAVSRGCALAPSPTDICTTGPIGTVCTADGAIYVGDIGGSRIYIAAANEGTFHLGTYGVSLGTTATDGPGNAIKALASIAANPKTGSCNAPPYNPPACVPNAHMQCRDKVPAGTWYIPAKDELNLVWTNREDINLTDKGFTMGTPYRSSTEVSASNTWIQRLNDGQQLNYGSKGLSYLVRCVRR